MEKIPDREKTITVRIRNNYENRRMRMTENKRRIDELARVHTLPTEELMALITDATPESDEYLFAQARKAREAVYGKAVYMRGLIEFTNY